MGISNGILLGYVDFKIQNKLNTDDFDLNKSIWPKKILRIQNDINFIRLIKEKFDLYINFNANSFILDGQRFDEISSHNNIKIKANYLVGYRYLLYYIARSNRRPATLQYTNN